jgi:hypothetical protein
MNSNKQKEISDVLQQFNRQVTKLLKIAESIIPNNHTIDWAKRVIKIIRNEDPPAILERCVDKLWDNREPIMKRDAEFFKVCKLDKYIKNDENKEWLDKLVNLIKTKYFELNANEQSYIWDCMEELLKNVIKYRLLQDDFAK